jgi:hypothetical protein
MVMSRSLWAACSLLLSQSFGEIEVLVHRAPLQYEIPEYLHLCLMIIIKD